MEGLIPKLFKSFKKSKTLRQHNPQSTPIHNIQDFYPDGYNLKYEVPVLQQQQQQQQQQRVDGFDEESKVRQRRQKSFSHVHYVDGRYSSEEPVDSSKQIVRFRSHRRMFSCVTGE